MSLFPSTILRKGNYCINNIAVSFLVAESAVPCKISFRIGKQPRNLTGYTVNTLNSGWSKTTSTRNLRGDARRR